MRMNTPRLAPLPAAYDDWQEGRDPAGITTQDPELTARLDPVLAGRRLANFLSVMTLEAQAIARACGKSHLHNLEPEDMVALTLEAAAMAHVPLAGTDWYPGQIRIVGDEGMATAAVEQLARHRIRKTASSYFLISFVDLFGRPARQAGAGFGDRRHAAGWRRICRLRGLFRHAALGSRCAGHGRSGKPHSVALEARSRLGRRPICACAANRWSRHRGMF